MKAKDLYIPCDFANRKPLLLDQFFFVPAYYKDHDKSPYSFFSKNEIFQTKAITYIEYCSGNGSWIINQAKKHPHINWIAVEMQFDRARKIWVKMKNQNLDNLFVVYGEALTFTKHYLESQVIDAIFINFPDPWPKKRHAKHRLVKQKFLLELSRICKKNKELTIVTDDVDAALRMCEETLSSNQWHPVFAKPYYIEDWPDYGDSYFKALWKEKGKKIHYFQFKNKESG